MNKFRNYFMAVLAIGSMSFLTSCGNDDEDEKPSPTLAITGPQGAGGAIAAGSPISIDITATNNGGSNLDKFEVRYTAPGTTQGLTLPDETVNNINQPNFQKTFTATAAQGGTESYTFIITNKDGKSTTQVVTFNSNDPNQGQQIKTYTTILMGSYQNTQYGSFLDAHEGIVYKQLQASQTANQGKIDIVYFYGATNQATLAAPNDAAFGTGSNQISMGVHGWATRNATMFKMASASDYTSSTTGAELQAAYDNASGTAGSKANMLTAGNVVAFKTADGKYGVARVSNVAGTQAGTITIDVKIQN